MIYRVLGVLLCVALIGLGHPARSDDESLREVRRLIEMMGMQPMMQAQSKNLVAAMKQGVAAVNPQRAREVDALFDQVIGPSIEKQLPGLLDDAMRLYAKAFSPQEVREMIAFYETPLGRKIIQTMPQLQQAMMVMGMDWGKRVLADVMPELRKQLEQRGLNRPRDL